MIKKEKKLPRIHSLSVNLNEREYKVFQKYLKEYRISNKAEVVRKALFTYILKQFDDNYPSLFDNIDKKN